MPQIRELDTIIDFLCHNNKVEFNPYPQYDDCVMQALNQLPPDMNYSANYEKIGDKEISQMNRKEIATMLTFIQRGERFCDGHIACYVEDGTLLKLMERLREIEGKQIADGSRFVAAIRGLLRK